MSWKKVKLKEVLIQIKSSINIDNIKEYKLVTVSNKGTIKLREIVKGIEISANKAYITQKGQFIYSRLSVHNGAFGIIPESLEGALVTSEMPLFEFKDNIINDFFIYSLQLKSFKFQLEQLTKGVGRTRVKEDSFLDLFIDLPPINIQKIIIQKIKSLNFLGDEISSQQTNQLNLIKQLRHAFLREAMQGKLMKSSNTKETGQQLLAKIKAEKAQLITEKKLKKEKELPPISEDEIPFEIPEHWAWCRLGDSLELLTDYHANGGYENLKANVELLENENFAIMLRTTNFHPNKYFDYKFITKEAYHFLEKSKVFPGDLIMNKIGDPGVVFFVDDRGKPMSLAMNLFLLRFSKNVSNFYMYSYLDMQKTHIKSFAKGSTSMTITKDAVKELVVPIPPLDEQEQIVTKLEELMAFCDGLEQSIKESQGYNEMLLQQVLREALQGEEV
jgi:type I restriction enzyme S subunit